MGGITDIISDIIMFFVNMVSDIISPFELYLDGLSFNIYLFSDTGWFSRDIQLFELSLYIMAIFMFIFLLRLLWKATKKFINMVFGVFRV